LKTIDLFDIGATSAILEEARESGCLPARVSAQHRGQYAVWCDVGELPARISGKLRFEAAGTAAFPAVGDWVLISPPEGAGAEAVIQAILPRTSCMVRKAAGTAEELQVIASNIDTVFICMSLNRDYNLRRLERYLAVVWESRAMPVVVLTKSDLEDDQEGKLYEIQAAAPGVDIAFTSALEDGGIEEIRRYISSGKTVAFIGSSGVGKSTLINALLGRGEIRTREIRGDDDRGRHTTTHRQMYLVPGGGIVIDTPGMRELQISSADLDRTFADIEEFAKRCRFSDCTHENEPGCAVKEAIAEGRLEIKRLENYKKLLRESAYEERKALLNAAQAEKQKTIQMMGSLKAQKQILKGKYAGR